MERIYANLSVSIFLQGSEEGRGRSLKVYGTRIIGDSLADAKRQAEEKVQEFFKRNPPLRECEHRVQLTAEPY